MVSQSKKVPDFLGIGMQRSGTSWVYTMLAAHPDIWIPPLKEMHFFDVIDEDLQNPSYRYRINLMTRIKQKAAHILNFPDRPELYKNSLRETLAWDAQYFFGGEENIEWYRSLFDERYTKGRVCGEVTPLYCNVSDQGIAKMLSLNPAMKFFLMIRHPFDRMWSAMILYHRAVLRQKFETVTVEQMHHWLSRERPQITSDTLTILRRWRDAVPQEQLLIRSFEDIKQKPDALIGDFYRFLGVNDTFRPPENLSGKKINNKTRQAYIMPDEIREALLKRTAPMVQAIEEEFPHLAEKWHNSRRAA